MASYIHFTEEEKRQARETDLASFLMARGEQLSRSGSEYEWTPRHITVRGGMWFDQYLQEGGTAVDFVMREYGMSFQEAVLTLLGGSYSEAAPDGEKAKPRKASKPESIEIVLPRANSNMKRVFAYLAKTRGIDYGVIMHFANRKLIYEDAEHHNAVFVGEDENGTPRHAHKKSTLTIGGANCRKNVAGSLMEYAFHHIGQSEYIFCFEAPIDMLSYITMHTEGWERHSYVSLCSVSDKALMHQLASYPALTKPVLCLDNDEAGKEATSRIKEKLLRLGYENVCVEEPTLKDVNEDLLAGRKRIEKPNESAGLCAGVKGDAAWEISLN